MNHNTINLKQSTIVNEKASVRVFARAAFILQQFCGAFLSTIPGLVQKCNSDAFFEPTKLLCILKARTPDAVGAVT